MVWFIKKRGGGGLEGAYGGQYQLCQLNRVGVRAGAHTRDLLMDPECLHVDGIRGFAGLSCHVCTTNALVSLQVPDAQRRKCLIQAAMRALVSSRKHDMFEDSGVLGCLRRLSKAFTLFFSSVCSLALTVRSSLKHQLKDTVMFARL